MLFLSCFCSVFVRVCLVMPCGQLLGKGWPLGSRLWCLIVKLSRSHWYPVSGVVLDCIDSWSLPSFLLFFKNQPPLDPKSNTLPPSHSASVPVPSTLLLFIICMLSNNFNLLSSKIKWNMKFGIGTLPFSVWATAWHNQHIYIKKGYSYLVWVYWR